MSTADDALSVTLRVRLLIGLLAIAGVLLVPLGFALQSLRTLHNTTQELREGEFAASLLLGRLRGVTDDLRRAEDALLFVYDQASMERMQRQLALAGAMTDSLDRYALALQAAQIRSSLGVLRGSTAAEFSEAAAGSARAAEVISSTRTRPAIATVDRAIVSAEVSLRERTRERVDAATRATANVEQAAAAALVIALLVATLIGFWLARSISRPVFDLVAGMKAVADNDLTYKLAIPPSRPDEFGRLSASYQSMTDQLAQLDKLKAEFVSVASHELKTPINVIVGYLELLDEGIYGELSEKQREICRVIDKQAKTLTRLVRRLLDVSRFEAGASKLERRQITLHRFLDALESSFQMLAAQRGVDFRVGCGDGLPAEVIWDEDRMNEVLGNLLSNAFKFTPRGGHVELGVSRVDESVQLVVRDTGAGIAEDELPHVFEKFFQAGNQAAAAVKGTGLGLAIARQIVEAHHGTISVESAVGKGTTFTITLPIRAGIPRTPPLT